MTTIARLRRFIGDMTSLVGGAWQDKDEAAIVEVGARLLGDLVKHDDWLPESMAKCPPHGYAQNLLWCDPFERFSVVSFVWAPSARDAGARSSDVGPGRHAARLGDVAGLRARRVDRRAGQGECATLAPGDVEVLRPSLGDIHQVTNALADCGSLSIHVYGGNIGAVRRYTFDPATGEPNLFVSGYTNKIVPEPVGPLGRGRARHRSASLLVALHAGLRWRTRG